MVAATVLLLPLSVFQVPATAPGWRAITGLLLLALLGTAAAQLVLYRLLRLYGARRSSLVTYLMPPFALAYGALLLDEPVTAAAVGGLGLILVGVALGSGAVGERRRRQAERVEAAAQSR
jgi:drug/metabolite transporter (DMT)-like permease